jgi:hypothetical protein
VRSGLRQDRIFYRKALFSCGGRVAHLIAFEYPASRKRELDRLVTAVSHSLRSHGKNCPRIEHHGLQLGGAALADRADTNWSAPPAQVRTVSAANGSAGRGLAG